MPVFVVHRTSMGMPLASIVDLDPTDYLDHMENLRQYERPRSIHSYYLPFNELIS